MRGTKNAKMPDMSINICDYHRQLSFSINKTIVVHLYQSDPERTTCLVSIQLQDSWEMSHSKLKRGIDVMYDAQLSCKKNINRNIQTFLVDY